MVCGLCQNKNKGYPLIKQIGIYERSSRMNRFKRLLILALALTVSGGLAYMFVPNFEPIKMIILAIVILTGSEIFCQIDKLLPYRNK